MQKLRTPSGFTLFELMIVVAILGFISALAAPSFVQYRLREETRSAAEVVASAIRSARDRSIREGRQWFVVFNSPNSVAPGAVARVVQDMDNNFQETPGDIARDVVFQQPPPQVTPYGLGPMTPFAAAPLLPNDTQPGTLGGVVDGSSFPFDAFSGRNAVGFSTRGIPVSLATPQVWGSGAGGFYVTENDQLVYAVDVGPLGEVKVRSFNAATNQWN